MARGGRTTAAGDHGRRGRGQGCATVDRVMAEDASMADEVMAEAASTVDRFVAEDASTADELVAEASSTSNEVVAETASTADELWPRLRSRQTRSLPRLRPRWTGSEYAESLPRGTFTEEGRDTSRAASRRFALWDLNAICPCAVTRKRPRRKRPTPCGHPSITSGPTWRSR